MSAVDRAAEAARLIDLVGNRLEHDALLAEAQVHAILALVDAVVDLSCKTQPIRDDEKFHCGHGYVICGACGIGAPMGGRS